MLPHLLILDADAAGLPGDQLTAFFLNSLVNGSIANASPEGFGFLAAIAHSSGGLSIFDMDLRETSICRWQTEIGRWLAGLQHAALQPVDNSSAGVTGLCKIPAHLHVSGVSFLTNVGSRSCAESALRPALDTFERQRPGCPLEILIVSSCSESQRPLMPSALIMLQAEFDLKPALLVDRIDVGAWISAFLASRQAVHVSLDLGRERDAVEVDDGDDLPSAHVSRKSSVLVCWGTPAILHEEHAADVPACVCHGLPLDSQHATHRHGGSRGTQSVDRCPISGLDLDSRDLKVMGCIGRYVWNGSLAAAASTTAPQTHAQGQEAVTAPSVLQAEARHGTNGMHLGHGPARPNVALRALSRVKLGELTLTTLFGHPWIVGPKPPHHAAATAPPGSGTPHEDALDHALQGMELSSDEELEVLGATLRGLSRALHTASEGLLLRCTSRDGFSTGHLANAQALLAPNLVLIPSGPPHHVLILKAVCAPTQLVPLPPVSDAPEDHLEDQMAREEARRQADGLARADRLLAQISLSDGFNPIFQSAGGTAVLLARCHASTTQPPTACHANHPASAPAPVAAPSLPTHHVGSASQPFDPRRHAPPQSQPATQPPRNYYHTSHVPPSMPMPMQADPYHPCFCDPLAAGGSSAAGSVCGGQQAARPWSSRQPPSHQQPAPRPAPTSALSRLQAIASRPLAPEARPGQQQLAPREPPPPQALPPQPMPLHGTSSLRGYVPPHAAPATGAPPAFGLDPAQHFGVDQDASSWLEHDMSAHNGSSGSNGAKPRTTKRKMQRIRVVGGD